MDRSGGKGNQKSGPDSSADEFQLTQQLQQQQQQQQLSNFYWQMMNAAAHTALSAQPPAATTAVSGGNAQTPASPAGGPFAAFPQFPVPMPGSVPPMPMPSTPPVQQQQQLYAHMLSMMQRQQQLYQIQRQQQQQQQHKQQQQQQQQMTKESKPLTMNSADGAHSQNRASTDRDTQSRVDVNQAGHPEQLMIGNYGRVRGNSGQRLQSANLTPRSVSMAAPKQTAPRRGHVSQWGTDTDSRSVKRQRNVKSESDEEEEEEADYDMYNDYDDDDDDSGNDTFDYDESDGGSSDSESSDEDGDWRNRKRKQVAKSPELIEETDENIIEMVMDDRHHKHVDASGEEVTTQQFLIKWKGWSHAHNDWFSKDDLSQFPGFRRVENYVRRKAQIAEWKKKATPEEIDQHDVLQEMNKQIQDEWTHVERIVTSRPLDNQVYVYGDQEYVASEEFLVKWKYLPYSECTWEFPKVVESLPNGVQEIDHFRKRERKGGYLAPLQMIRPAFKPLSEQPNWLSGGELRDYQLQGVNWLHSAWCNNTNTILADEMGLGKTVQTISFLSLLYHERQVPGPFLVIVPLSTIANWQKEFKKWAPQMYVVSYVGDTRSRRIIREYELFYKTQSGMRLKANVLLTTYEMIIRDAEHLARLSYRFMAIDEAHRLKNDQSKLYEILTKFTSHGKLLITGTPMQNTLKELWCLMHFIEPQKFPDYEIFEARYSRFHEQERLAELHKTLAPHMLRRLKSDVEKSLPKKIERILRVELSELQRKYYQWILTRNYTQLRKGGSKVSSLLNIVIELKKCCNHPFLFEGADTEVSSDRGRLQALIESSGKLLLLDKLLIRLKETGHRVLIFSQMVRMLDILSEYLTLRGFTFQRLDGSTTSLQRQHAVEHFNAEGSTDFCFLLSTRAGGLGINLHTADTVIIFDSDWNPQMDLQAEARAHRVGQLNTVNIYRLITKDSVEENILERAKQKLVLDHVVIQRMDTSGRMFISDNNAFSQPSSGKFTNFTKQELREVLRFGAEKLFKSDTNEHTTADSGSGDKKVSDMSIDEILARAETVDDETSASNPLMSAFKFSDVSGLVSSPSSLSVSDSNPSGGSSSDDEDSLWDSIIPEDVRKKVVEEEERKMALEMEEMLYAPKTRGARRRLFSIEADADYEPSPKRKSSREKKMLGGFSIQESRSFIREFFRLPDVDAMESILRAAKLSDRKSVSEGRAFAELIIDRCRSEPRNADEDAYFSSSRGETIEINSVNVNPSEMLRRYDGLQAIKRHIHTYNAPGEFRKMVGGTRSVRHWPVEWTLDDDANLLRGVQKHGFRCWEIIRTDPELGLQEKICPADKTRTAGVRLVKPIQLNRRLELLLNDLLFNDDTGSERTDCENEQGTRGNSERSRRNRKSGAPAEGVRGGPSGDSCARSLEPVSSTIRDLKAIASAGDEYDKSQSLKQIKKSLRIIGRHIEDILEDFSDAEERDQYETRLWEFVHREAETSGDARTLRALYGKLRKRESARRRRSGIVEEGHSQRREDVRSSSRRQRNRGVVSSERRSRPSLSDNSSGYESQSDWSNEEDYYSSNSSSSGGGGGVGGGGGRKRRRWK